MKKQKLREGFWRPIWLGNHHRLKCLGSWAYTQHCGVGAYGAVGCQLRGLGKTFQAKRIFAAWFFGGVGGGGCVRGAGFVEGWGIGVLLCAIAAEHAGAIHRAERKGKRKRKHEELTSNSMQHAGMIAANSKNSMK